MRKKGRPLGVVGILLASAISSHGMADDNDLFHRDRLTGDWDGARTKLEEKGLTFEASWTNFVDGMVGGDPTSGPYYGGHVYAALNFDGTRANFIDGFSFDISLEGHYGKTANNSAGTILPPTFAMNTIEGGNSVWGVTQFKATLQLADAVSAYAGKFTPLYGFRNAFIDGLGLTKFNNTAFVAKPVVGGAIAYSGWGAGLNWNFLESNGPHDRGGWLNFFIQDTNQTADRIGLDTLFANGVNLFGQVQVPVTLFGLPGNHLVSFVWSNRERTSLDIHQAIILPGGGIAPGTEDSTWNVYYSMDQYLYVDPHDPARGWGLFGKVEFSDGNPNPIKLVAAAGFGGTGSFDARPRDQWGVGAYFLEVSDTLERSLAGVVNIENEWGVEAFYNVALTPAASVSFSGQVLRGATSDDWETILGVRLSADF